MVWPMQNYRILLRSKDQDLQEGVFQSMRLHKEMHEGFPEHEAPQDNPWELLEHEAQREMHEICQSLRLYMAKEKKKGFAKAWGSTRQCMRFARAWGSTRQCMKVSRVWGSTGQCMKVLVQKLVFNHEVINPKNGWKFKENVCLVQRGKCNGCWLLQCRGVELLNVGKKTCRLFDSNCTKFYEWRWILWTTGYGVSYPKIFIMRIWILPLIPSPLLKARGV